MKRISFSPTQVFAYLSLMFILAAGTATIEAGSPRQAGLDFFSTSYLSPLPLANSRPTAFEFRDKRPLIVFTVEQLYSAVNDPQNAGKQIVLAPGVYFLSVNGPGGVPRPNGGRLELQQNMSLLGEVDDRDAVVIDAANLPRTSFVAPPVPLTAAIRLGRGSNSIEWLTVRNAVNGNANIGTDVNTTTTAFIRIAHIASTNSARGTDVRNFGPGAAGRMLIAEIVDNDFYNNKIGAQGEGLRLVNHAGATGGILIATLSGNRSHDNYLGLIVEDNGSSNANISVVSTGDQFDENGNGVFVGGGLSSGTAVANGNTVSFKAYGDSFANNNGFNNFDYGGLNVIAAENTSMPNGTSNNTVTVELHGCRFGNNRLYDIGAVGARSNPASIGLPGTNNRVTISGFPSRGVVFSAANSIPDYPGGMNSVTFVR